MDAPQVLCGGLLGDRHQASSRIDALGNGGFIRQDEGPGDRLDYLIVLNLFERKGRHGLLLLMNLASILTYLEHCSRLTDDFDPPVFPDSVDDFRSDDIFALVVWEVEVWIIAHSSNVG